MDTLCSVREFRVEKDLLTDVQSSLTAAGKALANKDIFPVPCEYFHFISKNPLETVWNEMVQLDRF